MLPKRFGRSLRGLKVLPKRFGRSSRGLNEFPKRFATFRKAENCENLYLVLI